MNGKVTDILDRPIYTFGQVDRLLGLKGGTARRWIDGYERAGKAYPPVVRPAATGSELVTWGEFVETRLLSEYRNAGVPLVRMRPAIERLREEFGVRYPLAYARPFALGRELVLKIQEDTGLEEPLRLVVVRNGQLVLAPPAERFVNSVEWYDANGTEFVVRLYPLPGNKSVVIDPERKFGEPVVRNRNVPTSVIAELVRAGDSIEMVADLYDLDRRDVEAALRYEGVSVNLVA